MINASIIIPARNAMATLPQTIRSVLEEIGQEGIEIIVVNDGQDAATAGLAEKFPIKVIDGNGQGAAAARNIGVKSSRGEILIFLDADCRVKPGWLAEHLATHKRYKGLLVAGGSICMEPESQFWARIDHYCSWYNVNSNLPAAWVPNHPAANMSVSRVTLEAVGDFRQDLSCAGVHEETEWQSRLLDLGGRIRFVPRAAVWHHDRNDLRSLLKHGYRWGYNSIEVKSGSTVSRFPWLYQKPLILILCFLVFAAVHTLYTIVCWLRAENAEPLLLWPFVFIGHLAYASGMANGGMRLFKKRQ